MAWQPTQLEKQRLDKLERLREAGVDPYPLRIERTHTTAEAISSFEVAKEVEPILVTVCGRLVSVRDVGKTVFAHVNDEFGRIQLFVRRDEIGEESHAIFRKLLDLGDFIQAGENLPCRPGTIARQATRCQLRHRNVQRHSTGGSSP